MTNNNSFLVRFSQGTGRNLGKAKNLTKSWKNFKNLFRKPDRSSERLKDYLKLPDKEQSFLKGRNGWFYRTQIEGKSRNRKSGLPSDLVTLDFDYATPELLQALIKGKIMGQWEWFLHTSRRHTAENPRFRLFIMLAEPVSNEFYNAVSRIVASYFDPEMTNVDKVSFRPAQMMYKPTASADSEFIFHENAGELVDWSELLDTFELTVGDWRDITKLPNVPNEHLRETAEKMEDPAQKPGIVGDFCRAYDIFDAIAAFKLPYEPVDDGSPDPRFTYMGGTTYNGAIVYDGGKFLYSHHGSDPVSDMEVNAFDLVRIHKFGDQDDVDETEKKITDRASWKAMVELCRGDKKFKSEQSKSKFDEDLLSQSDFDDMPEDDSPDEDDAPSAAADDDEDDFADITPLEGPEKHEVDESTFQIYDPFERPLRSKAKKGWVDGLRKDNNGNIISNLPNVSKILDSDGSTRNSLGFNEHMEEIVLIRPLNVKLPYVELYPVTDKINGELWTDRHRDAIRHVYEEESGPGKRGYNMRPTDRDIRSATNTIAQRVKFHPIRDYLNFWKAKFKADGQQPALSLVESLFVDYCGSPDDEYHRATAVKFMVACVARAFEPGHKFDYSPILHGAQGARKSTFIAILAQHWFGELSADFSNPQKLVEQMQGAWIMEIPELSSITRGQIEDVKAFLSGTFTKVRMAYAEKAGRHMRQQCFMGSTNDVQFLQDKTGNRRWWPIEVHGLIDTDKLRDNVGILWGAAATLYFEMRAAQPEGFLPLFLDDPKAKAQAEELQSKAEISTDVDLWVSRIWPFLEKEIEADEYDPESPKSHRFRTCIPEILESIESFPMQPNTQRIIGQALRQAGWIQEKSRVFPEFGSQKSFKPSVETQLRWEQEGKDAKGSGDDDLDNLV